MWDREGLQLKIKLPSIVKGKAKGHDSAASSSSASADVAPAASSGSAGAGPGAEALVPDCGRMAEQKQRWENQTAVLLKILASQTLKVRAKVWSESARHIRIETSQEYEHLQDPMKLRDMYISWAAGGYKKTRVDLEGLEQCTDAP